MPRHKLTLEEQLRGTEKALANPKTPERFRPSMQKSAEQLRKQLQKK